MSHFEILQERLRAEPRTWLVTGVAGFIGSNLLECLLGLGQKVVGLDNFSTGHRHNLSDVQERSAGAGESFRFIEGDVRDPETCRAACAGVDHVLHQAALGSVPRSIENPVATHQSNVDGFIHMLVAARDAGVRSFVYASSSSVYGDHPDLPKVESAIGTPLSPYAVSKRVDELYADVFARTYGMKCVGLRYFNVFGRRQDPNGAYAAVIPKWVGNLLTGQPCQIYGDGETSRDFCYIENVLQANLLAAERAGGAHEVYNVAFGERTTLNELFAMIRDGLAAQRPELRAVEAGYGNFRAGDVRHSLASIEKARAQLGYEPESSVADGLAAALDWYVRSASVWSGKAA